MAPPPSNQALGGHSDDGPSRPATAPCRVSSTPNLAVGCRKNRKHRDMCCAAPTAGYSAPMPCICDHAGSGTDAAAAGTGNPMIHVKSAARDGHAILRWHVVRGMPSIAHIRFLCAAHKSRAPLVTRACVASSSAQGHSNHHGVAYSRQVGEVIIDRRAPAEPKHMSMSTCRSPPQMKRESCDSKSRRAPMHTKARNHV